MINKTETTNLCLHPETVRYIARWVRKLYIPASSVGDNLHIADCIEGMVEKEKHDDN